jgi:exodeoxyribonuclease VII large subunit
VGELTRRARHLVESRFPLLWVSGEVCNYARAASGHCYFSLKDAQAQVRCVCFRQRAQLLDFELSNGMQVEVRVLPTLYEPRGEFQLTVETVRRAGLGLLFEAFERLKKKLEAEGLFAPERKRAIPSFPRRVGVVTSSQAAALRDVLATLKRRMPSLPVLVYAAPVQGEGAAARIAHAIRTASARGDVEVLLVCRGGGSMEDLWAYNDERVARAIAACRIPVVTGIGHETDFTIADFVADLRAATPTAAAAAASPDRAELDERLGALRRQLTNEFLRGLQRRMQQVDYLSRRLVHPGERLAHRLDALQHLRVRLHAAQRHRLALFGHRVQRNAARLSARAPNLRSLQLHCRSLGERIRTGMLSQLDRRGRALRAVKAHLLHLNPEAVLTRGYSIVTKRDGTIVRDSAALDMGEQVRLAFAAGIARARIEDKS